MKQARLTGASYCLTKSCVALGCDNDATYRMQISGTPTAAGSATDLCGSCADDVPDDKIVSRHVLTDQDIYKEQR